MPNYRKKPIVVKAIQWTGDNVEEIEEFMFPQTPRYLGKQFSNTDETVEIQTLEGIMTASLNDWIIRGIGGEFYPCKPNIFEATYEKEGEEDGKTED